MMAQSAAVTVAIPCYNEAPAIAAVIGHWRAALASATILVVDNNSNDGTGAIARAEGVEVIDVPEQGKGHAVQAIFAHVDRPDLTNTPDALVLTDGDGTYPADYIGALIEPILTGEADMVVAARRPTDQPNAMRPIRGLGNLLIRFAFFVLIGRPPGDLLSGYRAFNRRYRRLVRPQSSGFEIETELTIAADRLNLRVAEVSVPYYPRIAGTKSKLNEFRDGSRIVATILAGSLRATAPTFWIAWIAPTLVLGLLSWRLGSASAAVVTAAICLVTSILALPPFLGLNHRLSRRGPEASPSSSGVEGRTS